MQPDSWCCTQALWRHLPCVCEPKAVEKAQFCQDRFALAHLGMVQDWLHGRVCHFSTSFNEGSSELRRVYSGDLLMRKALIGSQV